MANSGWKRTAALAVFVVWAQAASAGETLSELCEIAAAFDGMISTFVYTIGPIGLVLFALRAFGGRISWAPFFAIGFAMFAHSSVPELIAWLTEGQGAVSCV